MPSLRDRQSPLLHTTIHAAALALIAGSVASVSLAQEGKDPKGNPNVPAAGGAVRDPKASGARPTSSRDGKGQATNPKGQTTPPGKDPSGGKDPTGGKAHTITSTPPAAPSHPAPAAGEATGDEALPQTIEHNFGDVPPGHFRFGPFAEAVDVKMLVDMVADHLKIQIISTDTALRDKKIQLYTPVDVPEEQLLDFLGLLLDQNGQYIAKSTIGNNIYEIEARPDAGGKVGSTTQVVPTRGLKPTSLQLAITQVLKGGPSATGQPGQQGGGGQQGPTNIAYLDDLGVLVITDTPRRISAVKDLITELSNEQIKLVFTRFEVHNLSASIAKQRMLDLLGQSQRTGTNAYNPNNPNDPNIANNTPITAVGGGTISSNIATRLVPDVQSNALTLRGRPEEIELIERLLKVVDVPNQLVPKWYAVGPASQALAEQGKRAGLGDVTTMQSTRGGNPQNANNPGGGNYFQDDGNGFPYNRNNQSNQTTSGPVFVLDADQRGFMYYGTPEQHAQLEKLVREFAEITQAERVVYEFYKLKFVDAEKVSDLIRGMINNTVPGGESPLIPSAGGPSGGTRGRGSVGLQQVIANNSAGAAGGGLDEIVATDQVHVLPDKSNNQVVVKAPQRLQAQFARLINKLDLRRPQVYIDAKIIVVTNREEFQLAVESQFLNAGDTTNVVRTLFPGSPTILPAINNILTPPTVRPATGIVAAIIKSDHVPLVVNALATSRSGRVVASPQLLVDDNEEATITSMNEEPTTTTTIGPDGTPTSTGFTAYQEAGPKLTVKPRLSTGDLLSMKYDLELSSFTTRPVGSDTGVPPPKITNKLKSDSVTLASDSTIVVGGLELTSKTSEVFKVPLLGDIPIIGELFKSTSTADDRRTVYVFITPRIMRDPLGNDLKFNSEGPGLRAGLENPLPPVKLELIQIHGGPPQETADQTPPPGTPASKPGPDLGTLNPVNPAVAPTQAPSSPTAPSPPTNPPADAPKP